MSTCLVTCGPASTRIDAVRRITNFSTGELGTLLVEALLSAGHEVICLRGEGATFRPPAGLTPVSFFSNEDFSEKLRKIARDLEIDHLFHAAALADFEVAAVSDAAGNPLLAEKIPSSVDGLVIRMRTAAKVIAGLRALFPKTRITGWKYELSGTRHEAFAKAERQLSEHRVDACVLNGAAYGTGFAWIVPASRYEVPDKSALVQFLLQKMEH